MVKDKIQSASKVLVFVEGDADKLLFRQLMRYYEFVCGQLKPYEICNLKGVTRYESKLLSKLRNEYLPDARKSGCKIKTVCCSYDTDVFEAKQPAIVDWTAIGKSVRKMGIEKFIQVKVESSIEDWLLDDINGICNYLTLKTIPPLKGKDGNEKLVHLYGKAHRMYQKGNKAADLISVLDMSVIRNKRKDVLKPLEMALGVVVDI